VSHLIQANPTETFVKLPSVSFNAPYSPPIAIQGSLEQMAGLSAIARLMSNSLGARKHLQPGEVRLAVATLYRWRIQLAWVLKHQTKTVFSSAFLSSNYQALESDGECLNALLDLCYEVFDFLAKVEQSRIVGQYTDFGRLFERLVQEVIDSDLNVFVSDKGEWQKIQKSHLAKLSAGQNPYPETYKWQHSHNFFNLVLAIVPANPKDNNQTRKARKSVREAFWKYRKAFSKTITETMRSKALCVAAPTEDGGIVIKSKRESGKPAIQRISKDFLTGGKEVRSKSLAVKAS
jgi:hypothetical protein